MTQNPPPGDGPAPGWYPHPTMANTQAYWDGAAWTDHLAPAAAPSSGATDSAARVFLLLVAMVAMLALIWVAAEIIT